MTYVFGACELDLGRSELRRAGVPVAIQPKPLALLAYLLAHRNRVVPKQELLRELWADAAVTESSLTKAVSIARKAIGGAGRAGAIRSVARRGYRFVGEVAVQGGAGARAGAPGPGAGSAGGAVRLVGREAELERLRGLWAEAVAGRGGLAIVAGPPGIGKTRLAEAFAAEVADAGGRVLVGRGREGEGVPAFWIFAQVLRRLVEEAGSEALRELAGGSRELAGLLPELAERAAPETAAPPAALQTVAPQTVGSDADPEQGRFRLFEAVAQTLVRASRRRALLVVLEDVQWAGPASLRLLEHLAFEGAEAPLLLLATLREGRPADERAALDRTLALLRQQPRTTDVELRSLSRREVAALLEQAIGRPPPPDLTSELFARTEGVPLFLREAIRLLAERGDLRHPERIRRFSVSLPGHVLDLVRRPVERLSPRAAELLAAASVVGRDFALGLAASAAEIPRAEALDFLDEAEAAGAVEPVPGAAASWRFGHALFQEAVYAALPAGRRARLHARVAAELERLHADDLDHVIAELAHHHHRSLAAGDPERAHACAVRAAERARRLCAYEQAAMHWEQARAALAHRAQVGARERLETLLALGEAHRLAGERHPRRRAFAAALELARDLASPLDTARAAIGLCDLSEWAPPDPDARRALAEAREALGEAAAAQRSRLLSRQAYLDILESPARAEPVARSAVALARESRDAEALSEALYVLHFALGGPDCVEERGALVRELVERRAAGSRRDPAVILLLDAASDRLLIGDAKGAAHLREEAATVAGERPHPGLVWHLRAHETGLALLEGRFGEAEALADEAYRLGTRIDHPYAQPVYRGHRALLALERGRPEGVFRWFDPARRYRYGALQWTDALVGRALAAAGRREEAEARLRNLTAEGLADLPRNLRWTATAVEIAHLCADLRDRERADLLAEALEPVADQHAVMALPILYGGPVTHALARLRALQGRRREADELFREARAAALSLGAHPTLARIGAGLK
jgi:DNA-binding winged helix-turn-helix (wHTH) protein